MSELFITESDNIHVCTYVSYVLTTVVGNLWKIGYVNFRKNVCSNVLGNNIIFGRGVGSDCIKVINSEMKSYVCSED